MAIEPVEADREDARTDTPQLSLGTAAARNLATTTKSAPQMQGITSRWLLRVLPWVETKGGVYRVNRRLSYAVGDGRVTFTNVGSDIQVIPAELCEIPFLRSYDDMDVLTALANKFKQQELQAGDVIVERGDPADQIVLIAHGKVNKIMTGKYGDDEVVDVWADGDHFSFRAILESRRLLAVHRQGGHALHRAHAQAGRVREARRAERNARARTSRPTRPCRRMPQDKSGQAEIALAAGHEGEPTLPGTFVDYELTPREYELSVAQTVLRIHTRVADLYNDPMNQTEHQLKLTIQALRERQEHELVNNHDFGLLHNCDLGQRIRTRTGPPTPDDFDELITRRRDAQFLLAHPRTIAAFARECTRAGIYPDNVPFHDATVPAWRGVPLLPCSKIPITSNSRARSSSCGPARTTRASSGCTRPASPTSASPASRSATWASTRRPSSTTS